MHKREKTTLLTNSTKKPQWILIDAKGKVLGRLASEIANILRGRHKPTYTPHVDGGDGVIVINADQIAVSGSKSSQKIYRNYTGNIGGLREIPYEVMLKRKPEEVVRRAVKGMVPRTKLGNAQMKKLRIFAGAEHSMEAQQPIQASI